MKKLLRKWLGITEQGIRLSEQRVRLDEFFELIPAKEHMHKEYIDWRSHDQHQKYIGEALGRVNLLANELKYEFYHEWEDDLTRYDPIPMTPQIEVTKIRKKK